LQPLFPLLHTPLYMSPLLATIQVVFPTTHHRIQAHMEPIYHAMDKAADRTITCALMHPVSMSDALCALSPA